MQLLLFLFLSFLQPLFIISHKGNPQKILQYPQQAQHPCHPPFHTQEGKQKADRNQYEKHHLICLMPCHLPQKHLPLIRPIDARRRFFFFIFRLMLRLFIIKIFSQPQKTDYYPCYSPRTQNIRIIAVLHEYGYRNKYDPCRQQKTALWSVSRSVRSAEIKISSSAMPT